MIRVKCIGHSSRYAVESLLKMFFPLERFSEKSPGENFLLTHVTSYHEQTQILVIGRFGKTLAAQQTFLSQNDWTEALQEAICSGCYSLLCKITQKTLPWGTLTGVRPVKRVHRMLSEGKKPDQVLEELKNRFFVSPQKASLALQTAQTQKRLLLPFYPKRYSLYISIPFCPTRCFYCSFVSQAIGEKSHLIASYLPLLYQELADTATLAKQYQLQLDCIYIGGGTPTILTADQLDELLCLVNRLFLPKQLREFTVEAGRPDTITPEKLKVLRNHGVDRICINPQSFSDSVLSAIGRKHTVEQTLEQYALARKMGFHLINMDFIAGLPEDTPELFSNSIGTAIELGAENITLHALSVKRSSDFHREGVSSTEAAEMLSKATEQLLSHGYHPYYLYRQKSMLSGLENVGYALSGTESPYNIAVMEENQTVLACGAGSVTKLVGREKIVRIFDYKYPMEYQKRFEEMQCRRRQIAEELQALCI